MDEPDIASWLGETPEAQTPSADQSCTACGYTGEMTSSGRGITCPACNVVLPARRPEGRVEKTMACPECGMSIGLTAESKGKTVICPGCASFLGTPFR